MLVSFGNKFLEPVYGLVKIHTGLHEVEKCGGHDGVDAYAKPNGFGERFRVDIVKPCVAQGYLSSQVGRQAVFHLLSRPR